MAKDGLKVVVLGDFKAGKTTIINELFLKEALLPRDYTEATAVPTYVCAGEPVLQVWERNDDGTETLKESMQAFTAEDVARMVTAENDETRAEMAQHLSRVLVQKPGILPPGITLVDTPGLNSTNVAIRVGTELEAKCADAVIYVVNSKQLAQRETELLSTLCGSSRLKVPTHVVLTVDDDKTENEIKRVKDAIRSQLAANGLSVGVSTFIFDQPGTDAAKPVDRIQSLGDIPFAGTSEQAPPPAAPLDVIGNVRNELLSFINNEVQQGRCARVSRELSLILQKMASALEQKLAVANAGEQRLADLEARLRTEEKVCTDMENCLVLEIQRQGLDARKRVSDRLESFGKEAAEAIDGMDSAKAVIEYVKQFPQKLSRISQQIIEEEGFATVDAVIDYARHYEMSVRTDLADIGTPSAELSINWMWKNIPSCLPSILGQALIFLPTLTKMSPWGKIIGPIAAFVIKHGLIDKFVFPMLQSRAKEAIGISGCMESMMEGIKSIEKELITRVREQLDVKERYADLKEAVRKARVSGVSPEEKAGLEEACKNVRAWVGGM